MTGMDVSWPRPEAPSLVDFLLARITEDEAVAREAAGIIGDGGWLHGNGAVKSTTLVRVAVTPVNRHIARHDPARVLAECDAKRRIISTLIAWEPDPTRPVRVETAEHDAWRMLCNLALPFADHPDYQEWRP